MKNYNQVIQSCAECVGACKSATSTLSTKEEPLNHQEHIYAQMWNDCATICEACIHFAGRNSPNLEPLMKLANSICEHTAKECSKHGTTECNKVANACHKCSDAFSKCSSQCRRCA